ncbi:dopamine beta hydroxylase-related protein [Dehalogenimonas sp. WBC-2]|nr:dopamine beta hydroxylase-related protein [Dehalogenimonas sp. WBC-2]
MEFPAGKYNDTLLVTGGLFRVSWSITEDTIFIGIKAKTTGWVAIALSPSLSKSQSDLMIGFVSDGQVNLVDSYDPGYSGDHPKDSVLGGKDDLQIISGSEANGVTTLEFKRLLNTGDPYDIAFVNGSNPFLYALGANDNTATEHSLVGFGDIKLTIVLTHS